MSVGGHGPQTGAPGPDVFIPGAAAAVLDPAVTGTRASDATTAVAIVVTRVRMRMCPSREQDARE
jgi:hypothetical protein